jgi:hypothetical protein
MIPKYQVMESGLLSVRVWLRFLYFISNLIWEYLMSTEEPPITIEELTEVVGPYWASRLINRSEVDILVFLELIATNKVSYLMAWKVMVVTNNN